MGKTIAISTKNSVMVHGYEIKRMPLGQFFNAIEVFNKAPNDFIKAMFPGKSLTEILAVLKTLDTDTMVSLMIQGMGVMPKLIIEIFSQLSGIEEEKFLSDPAIGFDGLIEMISAWVDINGLEVFIKGASELTGKIKAVLKSSQKQTTGSKDLSQQDLA